MKRLMLLAAVLCLAASSAATAATTSKTRKTTGVIHAGVTHSEAADLYVAGDFKDKLLGRGAIVYITRVSAGQEVGSFLVKARKITIYTPRGSLSGAGQATQTTTADGQTTVTNGTFRLRRGTGKLKGHRLSGTFSGAFADGVYTFNYKGTYK
jgi:hypothetical protein